MEQSISYKEMVVGLGSYIPCFLKIDNGIRFMLAPKSYRDFSKCNSRMVQGTVKLLGSFNLGKSFLRTMAEHSSLRVIVSNFTNIFVLPIMSFKTLGTWAFELLLQQKEY